MPSASVVIESRCTRRAGLAWLAAWAAATLLGKAQAADAPAAALPTAAGSANALLPPLRAELVKTGLYLITGGGGNVLLRLSAAGAVLVNGKQAGFYRPLMAQVRKISRLSDLPLRVLMLTDAADHHAANQALFAAAGVATLVQQSARPLLPPALAGPAAPLAASLAAPVAVAPAPAPAPAPAVVVTFDRDYHLQIGGVEVVMVHVGPVRTPADSVVLFPDLKVLAVGDLYTTATPTAAMVPAGGLAGWSQALARLMAMDFDLVIASDGPPLRRADLAALQARVDALAAVPGAQQPRP